MSTAFDQDTLQHLNFVCQRPSMFVPSGSLLETIAYVQGFLDARFGRGTPSDESRTPQEELGSRLDSNFLEWSRVLAEQLSDIERWNDALWHFFVEFARDVYQLEHEPLES